MEFSLDEVSLFENFIVYMTGNPTLYTEIEKSEAFIRIGVAYYFTGQFQKASAAFDAALSTRASLKADSNTAQVHILLGICYFRCGNTNNAEKHLETATSMRKIDEEIACLALANLAVLKCAVQQYKKAIQKANEALKFATTNRNYTPSKETLLDIVRVLIYCHLKNKDFPQVVQVVGKYGFDSAGKHQLYVCYHIICPLPVVLFRSRFVSGGL